MAAVSAASGSACCCGTPRSAPRTSTARALRARPSLGLGAVPAVRGPAAPALRATGRRALRVAAAAEPAVAASEGSEGLVASPTTSGTTVPTQPVWEIDFCSRPLLDERGKKVWELLICDPTREFQFSRYFPNNKINSTQLKNALNEVLAQPGAVKPERALFFRGQMTTIISRALTDLDIRPVPSRRCFTLMSMLESRLPEVYMADERYSEKAPTMFTFDIAAPVDLPDALRGEAWAFVQLPLDALREELEDVTGGKAFGATLDLADVNLGDLPGDTLIPGVAVFSRRADPLAAWTNGMELAAMRADTERAGLLLETGVKESWRYGTYKRSPQATAEAVAWEEAKRGAQGLHFLAVQNDPDAETCAGVWLLIDRVPPAI